MLTAQSSTSYWPQEAQNLEQTGLSFSLVLDLILKSAYLEGTIMLGVLAERTKLNLTIIHAAYRYMQKEQLCDTRVMVGNDYEISLTAKGRAMSDVAMKRSQYAGAAPVTLADYRHAVKAQALHLDLTRRNLEAAMHDLVLADNLVRELGAALGDKLNVRGASGATRVLTIRGLLDFGNTKLAMWRLPATTSSTRSSTVPGHTSRCEITVLPWPIRHARSRAWSSTAGFHQRS